MRSDQDLWRVWNQIDLDAALNSGGDGGRHGPGFVSAKDIRIFQRTALIDFKREKFVLARRYPADFKMPLLVRQRGFVQRAVLAAGRRSRARALPVRETLNGP